jgi:hypothetical protein
VSGIGAVAFVAAEAVGAAPSATTSAWTVSLKSGAIKQLLDTSSGLAWSLVLFCFVLALAIEIFGRAPGAPSDLGGCVWRLFVVIALLASYPKVTGSLINLATQLASRVEPKETLEQFAKTQAARIEAMTAASQQASDGQGASFAESIGGYVFDSLVALVVVFGNAIAWLMAFLARVLTVVLYVIGPIAIVFSIPRLGVGGRWLRMLATVLAWPFISNLLFRISLALGFEGMTAAQGMGAAFASILTSMLVVCVALVTPVLASALVGGGISNLVSAGVAVAWSHAVSGAAAAARFGDGMRTAGGHATAAASWAVERMSGGTPADAGTSRRLLSESEGGPGSGAGAIVPSHALAERVGVYERSPAYPLPPTPNKPSNLATPPKPSAPNTQS